MNAFDISASALSAQRLRMTTIAGNIANAETTRDAHGRPNPYRRLEVIFAPEGPDGESPGVQVTEIREDSDPFRWVRRPGHPDAITDPASEHYGDVLMPRINVVHEMVDMMLASRSYEANLTAIEVTKTMNVLQLLNSPD